MQKADFSLLRRQYHKKRYQSGVVLIMILIIFAIFTLTATQILDRLQSETAITGALLNRSQAKLLALDSEGYAVTILQAQWLAEVKIKQQPLDFLGQQWAESNLTFETQNGSVRINIEDAQGLFDLNSLASAVGRMRFIKLLQVLKLPTSLTSPIFKEVSRYGSLLSASPPSLLGGGRARGGPSGAVGEGSQGVRIFTDPTELLRIKGVSYRDYQKLAPFVVALTGRLPININTVKGPVLASLINSSIGLDIANGIVAKRGNRGFNSVEQFLSEMRLQGALRDTKSLSVTSSYFIVHTVAHYRSAKFYLQSLLYRNKEGRVRVLWRNFDQWHPPVHASA